MTNSDIPDVLKSWATPEDQKSPTRHGPILAYFTQAKVGLPVGILPTVSVVSKELYHHEEDVGLITNWKDQTVAVWFPQPTLQLCPEIDKEQSGCNHNIHAKELTKVVAWTPELERRFLDELDNRHLGLINDCEHVSLAFSSLSVSGEGA